MPTEPEKMFPVGNGAGEDTFVKGGKRTRIGVAHRSRRDVETGFMAGKSDIIDSLQEGAGNANTH